MKNLLIAVAAVSLISGVATTTASPVSQTPTQVGSWTYSATVNPVTDAVTVVGVANDANGPRALLGYICRPEEGSETLVAHYGAFLESARNNPTRQVIVRVDSDAPQTLLMNLGTDGRATLTRTGQETSDLLDRLETSERVVFQAIDYRYMSHRVIVDTAGFKAMREVAGCK